ncbi:ABC transporter permease [Sanguibacter sp. A247]|uniref:ABC transporter permease n=1 Tax=unclassified Sanguibacter TaxID=2645534 RepID=UPI003FD71F04
MTTDATNGATEGMTPAEIAQRYGLQQMGVRPGLREYLRAVWERRDFTLVLAQSKAEAENQNTYLGRVWDILNPTLNAAVYVLIFGLLLKTRDGMSNVVGFIVVGTFMYKFFSDSVTGSAKAIPRNLNLVRSLHFPRAVLPISSVLAELTMLAPALGVMALFVIVSDRWMFGINSQPTWAWFLLLPAVLMLFMFSTGAGFVLARLGARWPDILNFLPFVLRIGMYASGVIFSIDHYIRGNEALGAIMNYQPVAVYLNLARQAVLDEPSAPLALDMWLVGLAWAIIMLVVGFIVFWRDEARYGRD